MRLVILLGLFSLSLPGFAQNQADEFYDPVEMQKVREQIKKMGGGQIDYLLLADQFEFRSDDGDSSMAWDAQVWFGTDLNKLWLKTEGHYDLEENTTEEAAIQLLYSKAISPFWDVQLGLRHDFEPTPTRNYAVLGLQGLAPYWFEIDAAAFISDEGNISSRLEVEYDIRLSQRLILQPRLELNLAFSEDDELGSGTGVNNAQLGLRLRYEIKREIAPYLGINWYRAYGDSKDFRKQAGQNIEEFSVMAGFRFWY
jgi:copper resistance protein B